MDDTMNVEKMRKQVQRTTDAEIEADSQRWFDSITPEHRAKHLAATSVGMPCGVCIKASAQLVTESLRLWSARLAARKPSP
jgi:hypothetical protein